MRFGYIFLFCIVFSNCFCNDSLLIPQLFQNLLNKQIATNNFFIAGSFASYRQYNNNKNLKADNNIFYTALIAYTLQELKPWLNKNEIIVTDTIINRAKSAFDFYKNKKGRQSYNFWQTTNGVSFFPNDKILFALRNKLSLPDDLDDTSIILAAKSISDTTAKNAHLQMQPYINGNQKFIKNTFEKYKKIPAYSTWYGVKMPIDFDFGVHCNILSFVNKYNLQWSKADTATYNLIINMIDDSSLQNFPTYISPYYSNTIVLLYHIGRLMESKKLIELEARKQKLIEIARNELQKTNNLLNKVILSTTLMKWYATTPNFDLNRDVVEGSLNTTDFVYYTGHLFGHLNNGIKKIANKLNITQYKWFCGAFNDCLMLEYLILKHRKK